MGRARGQGPKVIARELKAKAFAKRPIAVRSIVFSSIQLLFQLLPTGPHIAKP